MAIAITLQQYLDNSDIDYELLSHPYSQSSSETARVGQISGEELAKAVLLEDAYGDYILAVIPSTHRVDFAPLNKQLNMRLGLATESELKEVFSDCQPGAVPVLSLYFCFQSNSCIPKSLSKPVLHSFWHQLPQRWVGKWIFSLPSTDCCY